jgi:Zn-dependent protease
MASAIISTPDPIFNCPSCSHYLPPGSLDCPDCHTLIYTRHLNALGHSAQSLESENKLPEARDAWRNALAWLPPESPQHAAIAGRIAQIEARIKSGEESKSKWTKRLGPLAPIALFFAKIKTALFFLFKLKFLLSFFAFFGIYWALFGWQFALGFTLAILVHEMGHYVAARTRGLKADMPVFLPGFGAYVRWYHQGVSLATLSLIALAGPFFGLLSALVCLGLYVPTHLTIFLALAYVVAWLNLINLIPVFGLDGAQAAFALNRLQRGLLLIACLVFFSMVHDLVYLLIAAGMAWRLFTRDAPEHPHTLTLVGFFLLLFALGTIIYLIPPSALPQGALPGRHW